MRNEEQRNSNKSRDFSRNYDNTERDWDMDSSRKSGRSFDREGRFQDQDRDFDSSYYNHRQERWGHSDRNFGEMDRMRETRDDSRSFGRNNSYDMTGSSSYSRGISDYNDMASPSLGAGSDYSGMGPSSYGTSQNDRLGPMNGSMSSGTGRDNSFFGGSNSSFQGDGWAGSNREDRSHFGKGPKGWKRSDERIREEACEALYRAHSVDASEIDLTVKDACVILKGTVDSREAKREAERVVERLSGVDDVQNELRVSRGMENSPTMNSTLTGTASNTNSKSASTSSTTSKLS